MEKYPPYSITDKMLNYVSDIMKKIGEANYFESLNRFSELRRNSIEDLKKIHGILTFLIEKDAGKFRNHGEGVYDGDICILHVHHIN